MPGEITRLLFWFFKDMADSAFERFLGALQSRDVRSALRRSVAPTARGLKGRPGGGHVQAELRVQGHFKRALFALRKKDESIVEKLAAMVAYLRVTRDPAEAEYVLHDHPRAERKKRPYVSKAKGGPRGPGKAKVRLAERMVAHQHGTFEAAMHQIETIVAEQRRLHHATTAQTLTYIARSLQLPRKKRSAKHPSKKSSSAGGVGRKPGKAVLHLAERIAAHRGITLETALRHVREELKGAKIHHGTRASLFKLIAMNAGLTGGTS